MSFTFQAKFDFKECNAKRLFHLMMRLSLIVPSLSLVKLSSSCSQLLSIVLKWVKTFLSNSLSISSLHKIAL